MKSNKMNKNAFLAMVAAVSLFVPFSSQAKETETAPKDKIVQKDVGLDKSFFPDWMPVDKNGNFDEKKAAQNFENLKIAEKAAELSDVADTIRGGGFTKKTQDKIADIIFGKDTPLAKQAKAIPLIDAEKENAFLLSRSRKDNPWDKLSSMIFCLLAISTAFAVSSDEDIRKSFYVKQALIIGIMATGIFVCNKIEVNRFKEHLSRPEFKEYVVNMQRKAYEDRAEKISGAVRRIKAGSKQVPSAVVIKNQKEK